jgi:hypothetical protein
MQTPDEIIETVVAEETKLDHLLTQARLGREADEAVSAFRRVMSALLDALRTVFAGQLLYPDFA